MEDNESIKRTAIETKEMRESRIINSHIMADDDAGPMSEKVSFIDHKSMMKLPLLWPEFALTKPVYFHNL